MKTDAVELLTTFINEANRIDRITKKTRAGAKEGPPHWWKHLMEAKRQSANSLRHIQQGTDCINAEYGFEKQLWANKKTV